MWYLYIIEKNGRLYIGITTALQNRLRQHGNPKLIYTEAFKEKTEAARREHQLKGWSRRKKLALAPANPKPVSLS